MMNRKINAVVILSSVLVLGFLPINVKAGSWENGFSNSGPGVALQKEEKRQKETKENVFGWIKDPSTSRWWYKNSDGTYPTNSWVWLDGDRNGLFECYFFDNEGWMLSNTTTPDGYTVDENGAWTKDDQVERRTEAKSDEIKKAVGWNYDTKEDKWWYKNEDGTFHRNTWAWLDGDGNSIAECYYFDSEGWLKTNTTTPDGYQVDENGAWIKDGQVQSIPGMTANNNDGNSKNMDISDKPNQTLDIQNPDSINIDSIKSQDLNNYIINGGLKINDLRTDGSHIGGFITDEEFLELSHYARSKGFVDIHKDYNNNMVTDKFSVSYVVFPDNIPKDSYAHGQGKKSSGEQYVELDIWMSRNKNYGTYTIIYSNGKTAYRDGNIHSKVYSKEEMKRAIDRAASHLN